MTPDNAQPPVTAQREDGWCGMCKSDPCECIVFPEPKVIARHKAQVIGDDGLTANERRIAALERALADQLEQHERELAAVKVRAYSFPWPVFAKTYVEMIEEELAELRRDRDEQERRHLAADASRVFQFEQAEKARAERDALYELVQDCVNGLGCQPGYVKGIVLDRMKAALAAHKPEASKEDGA